MPPKSKVEWLPDDLQKELSARLVKKKFSDFVNLADWLNGELKSRGMKLSLSHSAIHRYSKKFSKRLADIQRATEMANALVTSAGDDAGALNEAVVRLAQEKLFNILVEFDLDKKEESQKYLPKITRAIADISRASVQMNKFKEEVKRKTAFAAKAVATTAKKKGLTKETIEVIQAQILGIAS